MPTSFLAVMGDKKYVAKVSALLDERRKTRKVIEGLLEIAELAMPDTYYATDRRVRRAKRHLKTLSSMLVTP